jgi:hypothetical protein
VRGTTLPSWLRGANAPALDGAHFSAKIALEVILEGNDLDEMAPTQLFGERRNNLLIGEDFGEADHAEEISGAETVAEVDYQLCRQCRHNLFAEVSTLFLEDFRADAMADLPIE